MTKLFTSESVTEGHPDKIADQISDSVLDAILTQDKDARVACETTITTGVVFVSGEISTSAYVDIPKIVRQTVADIGYESDELAVMVSVDEQSPDIAQGVDSALESKDKETNENNGAGDQGLMFGYATNETHTLMPLPIHLSHALSKQLASVRKDGVLDYLKPDGKVQVTVEYDNNNQPLRVDTIVVSAQHEEHITQEQIKEDITEYVVEPVIDTNLIDNKTKFLINPTGKFVIGGPRSDVGLTGRKIIVDTYGGYARHGGGCFSGKDATKVDRSATYAARYVAKNIVASDLADKCEVQLAYAIGVAEPVSIAIDTFGTGKVNEDVLVKAVRETFDLTPTGIIKTLDLKQPIFKKTAAYGHFGRTDVLFNWEKIDKATLLKEAVYGEKKVPETPEDKLTNHKEKELRHGIEKAEDFSYLYVNKHLLNDLESISLKELFKVAKHSRHTSNDLKIKLSIYFKDSDKGVYVFRDNDKNLLTFSDDFISTNKYVNVPNSQRKIHKDIDKNLTAFIMENIEFLNYDCVEDVLVDNSNIHADYEKEELHIVFSVDIDASGYETDFVFNNDYAIFLTKTANKYEYKNNVDDSVIEFI